MADRGLKWFFWRTSKVLLLDLVLGASSLCEKLTHLQSIILPRMLKENCIQFPMAIITNNHELGPFKQQKFILSLFWRLEIQNQGVSGAKAIIPPQALRENLFLASLIKILAMAFRGHLDNLGSSHLKILNLVRSTKALFPNKLAFSFQGFDIDFGACVRVIFSLPQGL